MFGVMMKKWGILWNKDKDAALCPSYWPSPSGSSLSSPQLFGIFRLFSDNLEPFWGSPTFSGPLCQRSFSSSATFRIPFLLLLPKKWSQIPVPSIQGTSSPSSSSSVYLPSHFTMYPSPLTLSQSVAYQLSSTSSNRGIWFIYLLNKHLLNACYISFIQSAFIKQMIYLRACN